MTIRPIPSPAVPPGNPQPLPVATGLPPVAPRPSLAQLRALVEACIAVVDANGVAWLLDRDRTFRVAASDLAAELAAAWQALGPRRPRRVSLSTVAEVSRAALLGTP